MITKIIGFPLVVAAITILMPISPGVQIIGWIAVILLCLLGIAGIVNIEELSKDE
jgi:hypothetical protein